MTGQLNAFAVFHNICFRRTRLVINLLISSTSNINNENNTDNPYYYNNSNRRAVMKCRIKVFFGGFRQYVGVFRSHLVYFGLSSNRSGLGLQCLPSLNKYGKYGKEGNETVPTWTFQI